MGNFNFTVAIVFLLALGCRNAEISESAASKSKAQISQGKPSLENTQSLDAYCSNQKNHQLCNALIREVSQGLALASAPCAAEQSRMDAALNALNACLENHPTEPDMEFIDDAPQVK
jgi:hypothetical protein